MTTSATLPSGTPVTEQLAAEVVRLFPLSAEARQLLQDQHRLLPYLRLLVEKRLYDDGVRLLPHALPKREAVWWACQCARSAVGEAALKAAEQWAIDPNEANRRAAYEAAERVGFGTPGGCAALAAFFSGGSIGPAHVAAIPPDPLLTAQMVVNALLLAAVASEPAQAPERYDEYLKQGIALASGVTRMPARSGTG